MPSNMVIKCSEGKQRQNSSLPNKIAYKDNPMFLDSFYKVIGSKLERMIFIRLVFVANGIAPS